MYASPHHCNKGGVKFRCSGICVVKAWHPASSPYVPYMPQNCANHLIGTGRPVLVAFVLLAIWLEPSEPTRHAPIAPIVLAVYGGYAVLLALLVWRAKALLVGRRYGTHAGDVLLSIVFMYCTEGSTSPFFLSVSFVLLCVSLYWQRRGVVWTAVADLIVWLVLGAYAVEVLHGTAFALHTFVIRGVYVVVVALLLRYLNTYHQHLYGEMATFHREQSALLQQVQQATARPEWLQLARNLHDGVLQALTGAALHLAMILHLLEQEPQKARERLGTSTSCSWPSSRTSATSFRPLGHLLTLSLRRRWLWRPVWRIWASSVCGAWRGTCVWRA